MQARQDEHEAQHHLEKRVLMAWQAKEDADRLKNSREENREGSRATVLTQKDYSKIRLTWLNINSQIRGTSQPTERVCTSQNNEQ